jgi:hypothetical protein
MQTMPRSQALVLEAMLARRGGNLATYQDLLAQALLADPANQQARYLLLEERRPQLMAGGPDALTRGLLDGLAAQPASVLQAFSHWLAGDFGALQAMDIELAAVSSAEFWFPLAEELRARWRMALNTDDPAWWRDAAEFVESAIALRPGLGLYLLRAEAALRLNDPHRYLESMVYAGAAMHRQLALDRAAVAAGAMPVAPMAEWRRVLLDTLALMESGFLQETGVRGEWAHDQFRALMEQLDHLGTE